MKINLKYYKYYICNILNLNKIKIYAIKYE